MRYSNYQIGRAVVLFGDEHHKLWDITANVLKAMLSEEQYDKSTKPRIDGFRNGKGTVLIFDDESRVRKQEEDFPNYAENFAPWVSSHRGPIRLGDEDADRPSLLSWFILGLAIPWYPRSYHLDRSRTRRTRSQPPGKLVSSPFGQTSTSHTDPP